jgi:hypothetical protein
MKVAVYIGGAQDGFDTPGSGEPRYAYNLAHMLALEGHEVIAFGTGHGGHEPPLWGCQKPIPGIKFVHPYDVLGETFDVVLNKPFDLWVEGKILPCEEIDIRADLVCHTTFSKAGLASICKNMECCHSDHMVTMPYPLKGFDFGFKRELTDEELSFADKRVRWLPFPYYQELNYRPLIARREMTWVCKSLFSDEWPEDKDFHREGKICLEAVKNFAINIDKFTVNFAQAPMYHSERAKRFGVDKIFDIFCKRTSDGLFHYSKLNRYFSFSAVNLALPNFAASSFNAIANGCVSIFYRDDFMFGPSLSTSLRLHKRAPEREVSDILSSIYLNEKVYDRLIDEQRSKIVDYSYAASYKRFGKMTE